MKKLNLKINILKLKNLTVQKKDFLSLAKGFFSKKSLIGNFEMDLEFTNNLKIKKINNRYRKINKVTDVLSFPVFSRKAIAENLKKQKNDYMLLGSIIISYPQAVKNAKFENLSPEKEIQNLFCHGLKHLLGYHHK